MPEMKVLDAAVTSLQDAAGANIPQDNGPRVIKTLGKRKVGPLAGLAGLSLKSVGRPTTLVAAIASPAPATEGSAASTDPPEGYTLVRAEAEAKKAQIKKAVIPAAAGIAGVALSLAAGLTMPIAAAMGAGAAVGGWFLGNRKPHA